MARNQKLTSVIQGRTIADIQAQDDTLRITFTDGSVMTVKMGKIAPEEIVHGPTGTIKAVRQQGTTLNLDFTDGRTLTIPTAEPTDSVMLRAKDHTLEYAD
jgi:hypothetical protein